jgi:small subunit ribosomal protein S6
MPQYELMYLLGSHVADDQVSTIADTIRKFVEESGGSEIKEMRLGKKKLAYPIKKTRNGHYVVVNFNMDTKNVSQLDARVRSQGAAIIRYLLVNLEEHFGRLEKDKVEQAKLSRRTPEEMAQKIKESAPEKKTKAVPLLDIDSETLDKKIEEALSEDVTK